MKLWAALLLAVSIPAIAEDAHVIVQRDRAFHPGEITIAAGTALTFTNNDEFIHQIYSEDFFDTDEREPGQSVTETFTRAGTFVVRCHIHPKMSLVVHVK
jgi:plastocyanin